MKDLLLHFKKVNNTLLLAIVIGGLLLPVSARASDGLLFILDSSGSMWGRVEQQPKIVVAKKVLNNLLEGLPAEIDSGLLVYGHRRKGDCSDIELVSKIGTLPSKIQGELASLNAFGKTPISDALISAGKLLAGREEMTTIVLISDGIETCNGDPCQVAKQLRDQGLKLVLHVIGFDVNPAAAAQLNCIAAAGGGQFFQADSIDKLRASLMQVRAAAVEKKPLPEPPPPPDAGKVETTTSTSKTLRIAGPGKVVLKPAPWVTMPPRNWALTDIETGAAKASGNQNELRVRAGEYQIRWRQSEHNHLNTQLTNIIEVKAGKTVEAPIETGIRINLPEGLENPYWWGLIIPGENEPFWKSRTIGTGQVVPAGSFQLFWHQKQHGSTPLRLNIINIEEGKLNDVILGSGLNLRPAEWVTKKPYYYGLKDRNGDLVAKWNSFSPQLVTPGEYQLIYRPSQHHHGEIIWGDITITEERFAEVSLNSGLKFNHDPQTKPPYRIFLTNLDNGNEIEARETWEPLPAPPGRYRLDWHEVQHGSSRQVLAEEFTIDPETLIEVDL